MSGPISLADVLTAAARLAPGDQATLDAIVAMLGLGPGRPTSTPPPSLGVWQALATRAAQTTSAGIPMPPPSATTAPVTGFTGVPAATTPTTGRTRATLVERAAAPPQPPQWLSAPGEPLRETAADEDGRAVAPPLFPRSIDRAIIAAACATYVREGDVDLLALVEALARGRPIRTLPRLPIATLRRGARVLVDAGAGMDPYRADAEGLLARIRAILPADAVSVERFIGCPSLDPRESDEVTVGPASGVPVILISDLGIARPPAARSRERVSAGEWVRFARDARAAGHAVIAFVPYEPTRWPSRLAHAMTILHWSERTRIGTVRRAMREAARRTR